MLASPHAARSKFVNEELRLFKSRHPDRPVIPLIVDGEPGNPENECFPPALRFAVAPDGAITDTPIDVLAADLREKGDGFELALAKVVARLIGLAPDDVYRRAERERRQQGRLRTAIAAVIVVLAIAGGGFFWQSQQKQQTLDEIADPGRQVQPDHDRASDGSWRQAKPDGSDYRHRRKAPRPTRATRRRSRCSRPASRTEAEPLLKAVAEDKAKRADKDAKDAAAAYRNLASITAMSDPGRAREYYAEAARLDPSNVEGMFRTAGFRSKPATSTRRRPPTRA